MGVGVAQRSFASIKPLLTPRRHRVKPGALQPNSVAMDGAKHGLITHWPAACAGLAGVYCLYKLFLFVRQVLWQRVHSWLHLNNLFHTQRAQVLLNKDSCIQNKWMTFQKEVMHSQMLLVVRYAFKTAPII